MRDQVVCEKDVLLEYEDGFFVNEVYEITATSLGHQICLDEWDNYKGCLAEDSENYDCY